MEQLLPLTTLYSRYLCPISISELKRLRALGLEVETAEHAWVHGRSLYVTDPEGNQAELVCRVCG
jgi:hypothetical protein